MLRLLLSKVQGHKDFQKPSKPCHVGINWKALTEYTQISTHMSGLHSFLRFFFHHFVLAKLATIQYSNWLSLILYTTILQISLYTSGIQVKTHPGHSVLAIKPYSIPIGNDSSSTPELYRSHSILQVETHSGLSVIAIKSYSIPTVKYSSSTPES